MTLQERVVSWHTQRFPEARRSSNALKAMSELGEMADALLAEEREESATGKLGDGVTGEAADVVICLMVITGRWGGGDLLSAVERKLSALETPGAHRASLKAGDKFSAKLEDYRLRYLGAGDAD